MPLYTRGGSRMVRPGRRPAERPAAIRESMTATASRTVVLKFGTGILTRPDSVHLDDEQFDRLTTAVAGLRQAGHRCILVSSGAVGAGLRSFGLDARPADLGMLQACAAVGQSKLMHYYETLFRRFDLNVAQLLVTNADFRTEGRRHNFQATLLKLLEFDDVIPIINENDSVATEELRFGDNDALSAGVAVLAGADLLVLLTSVDGLHDADGAIIPRVDRIGDVIHLVRAETGRLSVGGMASKLQAVATAVEAGVETVIASGHRTDQFPELVAGGGIGTRFQGILLQAS